MRTRTLSNPFSCVQRFTKESWGAIFKDFNGNLDVEVGSGTGGFLLNYAQKNPDRSLVGFEIKAKLVDFITNHINDKKLTNTKVFRSNAHYGLEDLFDDQSIDRIFIFHPDPWPKRDHQRRRVINNDFLKLAYQKLKPGGQLYVSTDVPELWDYIVQTINQSNNQAKLFEYTQDQLFWETLYQTRWHEISLMRQKQLAYGTFKKN